MQSNICCDIRIFAEHDKGTEKPSDDTLTKCIIEMVSLLIQSLHLQYLIVDALQVDGCSNNSGMPAPREDVLDIVNTLEPLASLRVSLHNQSGQIKDIVDYISSVVHSDSKMQRWREEDGKLVIETLSEKADGM